MAPLGLGADKSLTPHNWVTHYLDAAVSQSCRDAYHLQVFFLLHCLQALRSSWSRRLTWPFRAASRLLRSSEVTERSFVPFPLTSRPAGELRGWSQSQGVASQFAALCNFSSGIVRVELSIEADVPGQMELTFADYSGACEPDSSFVADIEGRLDKELYVTLNAPCVGILFRPLNIPGRFRVNALKISKPSHIQGAWRDRRDMKLYRVVANLHAHVRAGKCRELIAKLFRGLPCRSSIQAATFGGTPSHRTETRGSTPRIPAEYRSARLRLAYVVAGGGMCGGVRVIMEHASRLHARGHDVRVFYASGSLDCYRMQVPCIGFAGAPSLKKALGEFRGIKVATWNETAHWVADSLHPADHGYYLIQDIEESYFDNAIDKQKVLDTYQLKLRPITEAIWVRDRFKEIVGLDPLYVGIGLDFDTFYPRPLAREPKRIMLQARTWSGGGAAGARLKGWETARRVIVQCHARNPGTSVTTFSLEGRPPLPGLIDHVHYRFPSDRLLASLYCQAGIYVLTSTHEGFGLTAAEAMACGAPVVCTRAHGNEEFCIDGVTALTTAPDDVDGLVDRCIRLQLDPELAQHLAASGLRFIREYSWDKVITRLEREFLQVNRRGAKDSALRQAS